MIFINIKSHKSVEAVEDFISSRAVCKYPFSWNIENNPVGINWIKNTSNKVCLYYENDKTANGLRTTWRAFFFGRIAKKDNGLALKGLILSEPIFTFLVIGLLIFLILGAIIFHDLSYISAFVIWYLFYGFIEFILRKDKAEIKKYLFDEFAATDRR